MTIPQAAGIKIMCGYGLSETSPVIAVRRSNDNFVGAGVVGRPPKKVELKIVNPETRETLPPTSTGEVCTRGPQVSSVAQSALIVNIWYNKD